MHDTPDSYRLSFSFGGLLVPETVIVARTFHATGDWEATRTQVLENNLLNKTRTSTSVRYVREIRDRLVAADAWERETVATATSEYDVRAVLLVIFARYYNLVGEFITHVVRRRLLDGLPSIDTAMVRSFMAEQATVHPELASLADSTAAKLASVIVRVLGEAGIVTGRQGVLPVHAPRVAPHVRDHYCRAGRITDLAHLLQSDEEIAPCLR